VPPGPSGSGGSRKRSAGGKVLDWSGVGLKETVVVGWFRGGQSNEMTTG